MAEPNPKPMAPSALFTASLVLGGPHRFAPQAGADLFEGDVQQAAVAERAVGAVEQDAGEGVVLPLLLPVGLDRRQDREGVTIPRSVISSSLSRPSRPGRCCRRPGGTNTSEHDGQRRPRITPCTRGLREVEGDRLGPHHVAERECRCMKRTGPPSSGVTSV